MVIIFDSAVWFDRSTTGKKKCLDLINGQGQSELHTSSESWANWWVDVIFCCRDRFCLYDTHNRLKVDTKRALADHLFVGSNRSRIECAVHSTTIDIRVLYRDQWNRSILLSMCISKAAINKEGRRRVRPNRSEPYTKKVREQTICVIVSTIQIPTISPVIEDNFSLNGH